MYSENNIVLRNFKLDKEMNSQDIVVETETNEKSSIAFVYGCEQLSPIFEYSMALAAAILVFVYILIMFELTHR